MTRALSYRRHLDRLREAQHAPKPLDATAPLSLQELDATLDLLRSSCALCGPLPLESPLRKVLVIRVIPKLEAQRARLLAGARP